LVDLEQQIEWQTLQLLQLQVVMEEGPDSR
jgi:hypothetical protein